MSDDRRMNTHSSGRVGEIDADATPLQKVRQGEGRDSRDASKGPNAMRSLIVVVVTLLSAIYLINPTAGIFELIPDNLPLLGNLDEAGAMVLLISGLRYLNIDIARLFERKTP